jgi:hypothetical protein
MPNQPKTPVRSHRIPDEEYLPAVEKAKAEGIMTGTALMRMLIRKYVVGAALLVLVMASVSGSAQASAPIVAAAPMSASASFVATVRQIGVGTTIADQTDAYLIRGGKSICADFDAGQTRQSMWAQVSPYYSPRMFDGVLHAAVGAFCPSRLSVL